MCTYIQQTKKQVPLLVRKREYVQADLSVQLEIWTPAFFNLNSIIMKNFLKEALETATVFKTPEKILKVVEKHSLIKNPPYGKCILGL